MESCENIHCCMFSLGFKGVTREQCFLTSFVGLWEA